MKFETRLSKFKKQYGTQVEHLKHISDGSSKNKQFQPMK